MLENLQHNVLDIASKVNEVIAARKVQDRRTTPPLRVGLRVVLNVFTSMEEINGPSRHEA